MGCGYSVKTYDDLNIDGNNRSGNENQTREHNVLDWPGRKFQGGLNAIIVDRRTDFLGHTFKENNFCYAI